MLKIRKTHLPGTLWFIATLIIGFLGATIPFAQYKTLIWVILGISGAAIAILNIKVKEEVTFLVGTIALIVVVIAFTVIQEISQVTSGLVDFRLFLVNYAIAFGIAGFVVSLALMAKIGLED